MLGRKSLFLLFFIFSHFVYSQNISGIVIDDRTKEPLFGATVYIDGTTIGVITDSKGYFQLEWEKTSNSLLVISYLGYETKAFRTEKFVTPKSISLVQKRINLDEIILPPDGWSRKKKLRIFKSEFLGKSVSSKYCKILNSKDITLIYNSNKNTLTAISDNPIIIANKYLNYKISYNLKDFEVQFENSTNSYSVYYAGTSFFSDQSSKTRKNNISNREKEYYGSLIHFMRSLYNKTLVENNFEIYYKRTHADPYQYFKINFEHELTKVELTVDIISILFNNSDQSIIKNWGNSKIFYIDKNGNHSPPNSLWFGGNFGFKRISNMLPLDYTPLLN